MWQLPAPGRVTSSSPSGPRRSTPVTGSGEGQPRLALVIIVQRQKSDHDARRRDQQYECIRLDSLAFPSGAEARSGWGICPTRSRGSGCLACCTTPGAGPGTADQEETMATSTPSTLPAADFGLVEVRPPELDGYTVNFLHFTARSIWRGCCVGYRATCVLPALGDRDRRPDDCPLPRPRGGRARRGTSSIWPRATFRPTTPVPG